MKGNWMGLGDARVEGMGIVERRERVEGEMKKKFVYLE